MGGKGSTMSSKRRKLKKQFKGWLATVLLILMAIVMLLPFYYVLVSTFKTAEEVTFHPMAWPTEWHLERYVSAFWEMDYPRSLLNTLLISIPTVLLSTLFSAAAAYSIVRCQNRLNRCIYTLFLTGIIIPGGANLIALYKLMLALHLNNTRIGLILLSCGGVSLLSLFMLRNFLSSAVTVEIEEAADIDGCGILGKFIFIALPLMKSILATNIIVSLTNVWNSFMYPSLFLQDRSKHPLLVKVYECVGQFSTDWLTMFNMLVLALIPLTILFLIFQKQIIEGVASGAVKG